MDELRSSGTIFGLTADGRWMCISRAPEKLAFIHAHTIQTDTRDYRELLGVVEEYDPAKHGHLLKQHVAEKPDLIPPVDPKA
jgi:hypothetical protein